MFFEVYDTDSPVGEVLLSSVEVCNMIADLRLRMIFEKKNFNQFSEMTVVEYMISNIAVVTTSTRFSSENGSALA